MRLVFFLILALLASLVLCDLYMHNPRGSNNRFRERRATRTSGNRLFDSQNNDRGGYNAGDRSQKGSNNNNNAGETVNEVTEIYPTNADGSFATTSYVVRTTGLVTTTPYVHPFKRSPRISSNSNLQNGQYDDTEPESLYQMVYLEGSELDIEWTNQHSCGGDEATDPHKMNCALVFQFMCESKPSQPSSARGDSTTAYPQHPGDERGLHDGYDTNANNIRILDGQNANVRFASAGADVGDVTSQRGYHESINYYNHCMSRRRNFGLFNADQAINGASARFTRQNPNGNRNGFECPEERDYYPYWGITPWRDIAILTNQYTTPGVCNYYQARSQNVEAKGTCYYTGNSINPDNGGQNNAAQLIPIDAAGCTNLGGTWTTFKWTNLPAPDCQPAPWSRDNHLGNGRDGKLLKYTWKLPTLSQVPEAFQYSDTDGTKYVKCVLRMRYNNTSDDYDQTPGDVVVVDSSYNPANPNGNGQTVRGTKQSPFFPLRPNQNQNSYYADTHGHGFDQTNVRNNDNNGATFIPKDGFLRLAINTAQFGRVFEDRSHTFFIKTRPAGHVDNDASKPFWSDVRIVNLNVRGKRCNIVECYPALEYDFVPHDFNVSSADFIHVQWTGSNSHTNGNGGPDGDGQAGNSGQGRSSTDRHNIVQISDYGLNYPVPLDKAPDNMWSRSTCRDIFGKDLNSAQLTPRTYDNIRNNPAAINCALHLATSGYYATRNEIATMMHHMQPTLNDAPPSLVGGVLIQFDGVGQSPLYPGQSAVTDPVTFKYMSSRNNAFTNRSQKGSITVIP